MLLSSQFQKSNTLGIPNSALGSGSKRIFSCVKYDGETVEGYFLKDFLRSLYDASIQQRKLFQGFNTAEAPKLA